MKYLNLLLLLSLSNIGFAQAPAKEKPDYNKIETDIRNEASDLYYERLFLGYRLSDSTLSLVQKRNLYYGFIFQNGYSPYEHSAYRDSIRSLTLRENFSETDFRTLVSFSDSILEENPFDLDALNYRLYGYAKLGNKMEFDNTLVKMRIIVDAIMSSGDGLSKESAFYVIYVSHEYSLINILGYEFGGSQSLIGHCDYLELSPGKSGVKGLYFDISPCLEHLGGLLNK